MKFKEWLTIVSGGESNTAIAEATDVPRRTLQSQIKNGAQFDTVITISETYGANPITALVNLDLIDRGHLQALVGDVAATLRAASSDDLGAEVLRRLKAGEAGSLDKPVSEMEDELAVKRNGRSSIATPDVVPMPDDAVADGTEDHPEEDDEFP